MPDTTIIKSKRNICRYLTTSVTEKVFAEGTSSSQGRASRA